MSSPKIRTKKKSSSQDHSPDSFPVRSSGRQVQRFRDEEQSQQVAICCKGAIQILRNINNLSYYTAPGIELQGGIILVKKKFCDKSDDEEDPSEKKFRKCEKTGCTSTYPVCFASAAERCAKNGYTSRWYHLSCGEHFCNECFDHYYRSHKDGYEKFCFWKRVWTSNGKSEPSPKAFMADQQVPFWMTISDPMPDSVRTPRPTWLCFDTSEKVQCTKPECGKWRQLTKEIQLTSQMTQTYRCGMKLNNVKIMSSSTGRWEPHTSILGRSMKYSVALLGHLIQLNTGSKKKTLVDVSAMVIAPVMAIVIKTERSAQCTMPEDLRVSEVAHNFWYGMLILPPLLKDCPAAPLLSAYYPDCVGMSPSCTSTRRIPISGKPVPPHVPGMNPNFQPFYQPNECGKALCIRPDVMELDELYEFPEYSRDPTMYLALRNLILAMWHLNCKEALTPQKCAPNIIVRGLVRIRCVQEVEKILHFMARKGLVNTGVLSVSPEQPLLPKDFHNKSVIVIGAGPSGLAAARQLQNFGIKVMVLEAKDRVGGRVWDDKSFKGVTVGKGAQIVNGCINNPITLMCEQLGIQMRKLRERCDLIQEGGRLTDPTIDKRMDFHFNAILDVVAEWRKDKSQDQDVPLGEKIEEVYKAFVQESGIPFTELEEKVLQFHLSNLEYACGSNLHQVSARSWDHNEFFAQFSGDHTLLTAGYSAIMEKLAEGLDIRLKCPVRTVDYTGEVGRITTANGTVCTAQKILVTVPLALLQKGVIRFNPPLPEKKMKAIHSLGAGIIEKVALQFPHRFWDGKIQGADFFGHIPPSPNKRGLFGVFYDMDPECKQAVLMTVITGDAVAFMKDMDDKQVIQQCMIVLRQLFHEQEVPDPIKYFVTRWSKDPWAQMAYSFVKTGGSGEAYDILAEDVQGKIFFAGEATNRHFPQTVTGAYLSGVREASKIAAF